MGLTRLRFVSCPVLRYPMAMGTLADLEDQEPISGKESPMNIHLKVSSDDGTLRRNVEKNKGSNNGLNIL